MKKINLFYLLGVLFLIACGNNKEVKEEQSNTALQEVETEPGIKFFEGSWMDALAKADQEGKIIFLDAYASWCGPCKIMARNTFPDREVGNYFNKYFINYKMDMEKNPNGPRLSRKFALTAYPTLFFIDKNEELVHKQVGYLNPNQLLTVGEIAQGK